MHKVLIESCKTREMHRREARQATPCQWRRTNITLEDEYLARSSLRMTKFPADLLTR
jgi:hypothetical protein